MLRWSKVGFCSAVKLGWSRTRNIITESWKHAEWNTAEMFHDDTFHKLKIQTS